MVIGRDAEMCQIVIPHHAVSRKHAQIVRQNGEYFLEDLKSRNRTFLNNKEVQSRLPLRSEDRIKICDFLFLFKDDRPTKSQDLPDWLRPQRSSNDAEGEEPDCTTVEASLTRRNSSHLLETQPAERIRALLDISTSLSRTLELDPLLSQIATTLFNIFRQADRCFVILLDENGRAVPKVVKNRRDRDDDQRFSKTIVKRTIETMESYLSEDASADASLGPSQSIAEFKIRSVMCVPLTSSEEKALGAIQLDTHDRAKKFREDDLKLLSIVANLASVAIEKARWHQAALARERELQEMELARQVQLGFLPQTLPICTGYEFYSHYSPAKTIGGDYYDFISLPDGRIAVAVGDVAGKGVPAALLTAKLSSEVRYAILTQANASEAMSALNDSLMRGGLGDRFVTMILAVLDPLAHRLTLVNAGHVTPMLFQSESQQLHEAMPSETVGLPLGVIPGYEYEAVESTLDVGDLLTLITDGVTDAMNPTGDFFGIAGVKKLFQPEEVILAGDTRPQRVGARIIAAVRKFAGGQPQNDDIALVCFGRIDPHQGPVTAFVHHPSGTTRLPFRH